MHLLVFRIQKWSTCESRLFIANWKDKTIRKKIGLGFYRDFKEKFYSTNGRTLYRHYTNLWRASGKFFYEFIDFGENRALLKGVAGSGNRNFNTSFCSNARALAAKYQIPLLHCFENQGTDKDVQILIEKVREIG